MPPFKTRFYPTAGQVPPTPIPAGLVVKGPVVPVQFEVSSALAKRLAEINQPIPAPQVGVGLVDTGATYSAIDRKIAEKLALQPIGTAKVGTGAGPTIAPVYAVKFTIFGGPNIVLEDGYVTGMNLEGMEFVALLGRSFLQHVILIYDGPGAEFTIAL